MKTIIKWLCRVFGIAYVNGCRSTDCKHNQAEQCGRKAIELYKGSSYAVCLSKEDR